jgi:hypothetical protein
MYVLIFKNLYTTLKNTYIWFEEYGIERPQMAMDDHRRPQMAADDHKQQGMTTNNGGRPRMANDHRRRTTIDDKWP